MNGSVAEIVLNIDVEQLGWEDGRVIQDLISTDKQYTVKNHSIELVLPAWGGICLG
jgi:hypothetical protein